MNQRLIHVGTWILSGLLWLAAPAGWANSRDVGGVSYAEELKLGANTVKLNGAGVRYRAVFKVYTAGLYLSSATANADEALAQEGPKRISITMLRDIDANELGKLFTRGVEDNSSRSEYGALVPGLVRMGQMFADQKVLKAGDSFYVDWLPGVGTQVVVRNTVQGEPIREPAFFKALMRIWLGANPADRALKDALLGKKE